MEYTTLANLKLYLGITGTDNDVTLAKIITIITKQFDQILGRNLEASNYEEYFDFDSEKVILTRYPIKTLLEAKRDDTDGEDLEIKRTGNVSVILEYNVTGDVFIKYEAGYDDLSDIPDVEQACLEACKNMWDLSPESGVVTDVKSEKVGELSQSYFSKEEVKSFVNINFRSTLKKYKPISVIKA